MEYLGPARLTASGLDDNDGGDQTNDQARREYLTYCVSTIDNNKSGAQHRRAYGRKETNKLEIFGCLKYSKDCPIFSIETPSRQKYKTHKSKEHQVSLDPCSLLNPTPPTPMQTQGLKAFGQR